MKSYKEFSEEAHQLNEGPRRVPSLGGGRKRGPRGGGGGPNIIGPAAQGAAAIAGHAANLGINALKGAGGLAANVLKSILNGDNDEGGEKVSKSSPLKSVEKHT